MLRLPPPFFSFLRIFGFQTDGLTIIAESDWKLFCEEWGGVEGKGISAKIEFSNAVENDLGSCEGMPIMEEHLSSLDEPNDELESRRPVIRTYPEANYSTFNLHITLC